MSYGLFVPEVLNEAARTISILRDQAMAKPKTQAPNAIDVHVGSRVRMRRMMLGMSQQTLAKAFGLTFQQVQKYEKGVNRIGGARLIELATALECDTGYFLTDTKGNGKQHVTGKFVEFLATKDGVEINEAMMKLDEPHRRSIIELARILVRAYGD